jgi:hypothetical protein
MSSEQPSAKRQKTYEADGPVEDDKTARKKLRDAGFDPDDVHTARSDLEDDFFHYDLNITPMAYFSFKGDLPMCRYLHHIRGAVTTRAAGEHLSVPDEDNNWFPIYAAAYKHNFEIVKWLYQNGAEDEILDHGGYDNGFNDKSSVLSACFASKYLRPGVFPNGSVDLAKWLVMEGVLEDEGNGFERITIGDVFFEIERESKTFHDSPTYVPNAFLGWMEELVAPNNAFHTFQLGTVQAPQFSVATMKKIVAERLGSVGAASILVDGAIANGSLQDAWDQLMPTSTNACLAPFPGVLEKIGDYVGILKSKPKLRRIKGASFAAKEILVMYE